MAYMNESRHISIWANEQLNLLPVCVCVTLIDCANERLHTHIAFVCSHIDFVCSHIDCVCSHIDCANERPHVDAKREASQSDC